MTKPRSPAVSVVVPHYNDPLALDLCLTALEAQTMSRDDFEIVVADNGSPCGIDAVRAVVRDRARLVPVAQKGAGPARNGAVAATSAPLLAFTDCDCIPAPGWLAAGLAALAVHDIVGGRVMVATRNAHGMSPTEAFEAAFAFDFERYITREGFTGSGNLFVSRVLFDRIGGFRTGVSEDKEWCHRAARLGYRTAYEPCAVVAHPARQSWRDLKAKWLRIQSESYGLARSTGSGRLRWLIRTWLMPASIIPHTIRLFRHSALPDLPTRIAAAGILVRQRLWRFVDGHMLLLGWRT